MAIETPLVSSGLVRGAYGGAKTLPSAPTETAQPSFGEMVRESAASAVETIRTGEATAAAGLRGEASTQEVVEAVLSMQSTVQTAVSVRDRFVEAYQEIMRMPI